MNKWMKTLASGDKIQSIFIIPIFFLSLLFCFFHSLFCRFLLIESHQWSGLARKFIQSWKRTEMENHANKERQRQKRTVSMAFGLHQMSNALVCKCFTFGILWWKWSITHRMNRIYCYTIIHIYSHLFCPWTKASKGDQKNLRQMWCFIQLSLHRIGKRKETATKAILTFMYATRQIDFSFATSFACFFFVYWIETVPFLRFYIL